MQGASVEDLYAVTESVMPTSQWCSIVTMSLTCYFSRSDLTSWQRRIADRRPHGGKLKRAIKNTYASAMRGISRLSAIERV